MGNLPTYLRTLLYSVILFLAGNTAYANHLVGMDMFYTYISGNTYKITLIAYGDCGSAAVSPAFGALSSNAPQIHIYNGDTYIGSINLNIEAPSAGVEITPVCPADISLTQCTDPSFAIPGIKKFVYSAVYTLPSASSVWRFLFTGQMTGSIAGRALSITNISSTPVDSYIQLVDTLDNTGLHNSSPALSNVPTPFFCLDNDDNYNPGAIDPDGDSLTFFLVAGQNGTTSTIPGGLVTYIFPYTPTNPLAVTTMTFDNTTGQIAFNPNQLQRSLVVYNIEEHRNGVLTGTSQREMTFLVQSCTNTPPTGALSSASTGVIDDDTHFHVCSGTGNFSVQINPTEATTTNNITVTTVGLPTGSTFTVTGNGTPAPHGVFSWTTTGVPTGSYTFYVTYTDNNCPLAGTQTLAYTITIGAQPTISYTLLAGETCTRKAVLNIVPSGPGGPWTVDVSSGTDTIQTFTRTTGAFTDSLVAGSYVLTVYASPGHGCSASVPVTIAAPVPPVITATSTPPSYCGNNDGSIVIHHLPTGASDTIRYTIGGVTHTIAHAVASDSTITLTGLTAGTYSNITATYGNCLTAPISVTLTSPPFTMRALSFVNPVFCGICNGSITLYGLHPGQFDTINYTLNGVAQAPIVRLIGADSTVTLNNLCAGIYDNFVARTGGTCVSNSLGPATLVAPPLTIRTATSVNPDFCGICNGSITIHGVHPSMFDTVYFTKDGVAQTPFPFFVGSDSTITLSNLCAGNYTNIYVQSGVCVSNSLGPVALTVPPFTIRTFTSVNPVYCGVCNGTITLYGLHPGMTDTINYDFNGVPQTQFVHLVGADSTTTLTGLCGGAYSNITARSGNACITPAVGPVTLTVPPYTIRSLTFTNPDFCGICNGSVTIHGLFPGETDSIHYTKDGIAQTPFVHLVGADSTITITGLCAGVYDNFVSQTGGVCVSNILGPATLTVPPFTMRAISVTNPDFCGICNGTITLYGLHPGQTDSIHYTKDGVAQTPFVHLVGADSTITLTGLCAGVYDNFVAHTGGVCVSNTLGPVSLTVPPFTVRTYTATNPDYCGICNGTITLYGLHPGQTDSIHYTKDGIAQTPYVQLVGADSTITMTGLCAGVYDNIVAHTGGVCASNALGPVSLTVPPFTMRSLTFTNPDFCGICNGTITLYGLHPGQTDTINYTIDGVAQTPIVRVIGADSTVSLTGLCAGLYANFVANTGGTCVSNILGPANLVVPPFTMRAITATNPTKCGFCDGTIRLYGLHPGQLDTITYTYNGVVQPQVAMIIPPDSIVLLPSLCEGIYGNFVAKTGGVCVSNELGPVTLTAPPITAAFTASISKGCSGDTVTFTNSSTPASDLTYRWDFGDGSTDTATNPVHIYTSYAIFTAKLIITNTRCYDSTTQPVEVDNLVKAGFTESPDSFLCQKNPVTFTNTSLGSRMNYRWFFGDGSTDTNTNTSHIYTRAGVYDITLAVANYVPCYDTVKNTIAVDSISAINIGLTDSVICGGTSIEFTGIYSTLGNKGVIWTFGDGYTVLNENPVTHSFPLGGEYTVTVEALYRACPDTSATKQITIFSRPNINIGPDTSICPGSQPLQLTDADNNTNPKARWRWSTGQTGPSITVVEPGEYAATVIIDGCEATDSVIVNKGCYLDIPNVFTPNDDGINDYFFPRNLLTRGLATFKMSIFNRWGQLIFETTSTDGRGWDGRWNGVQQPEGVFIYIMDATFIDGEKEHHQGNITLLR